MKATMTMVGAMAIALFANSAGAQGGGTSSKVQQDLQKLHAANQAEIQLQPRVDQNAVSPEVKQVAATLAEQHTADDQQLQQIATQLGINLEGKTYRRELSNQNQRADKQLKGKTGEAFDRAYAKFMVQDHKEDVNKNLPSWIHDAQNAHEPAVVSFLQQTRTTLEHHLQLAQQLQAHEQQQAQSGNAAESGTGSSGAGTGSANGR